MFALQKLGQFLVLGVSFKGSNIGNIKIVTIGTTSDIKRDAPNVWQPKLFTRKLYKKKSIFSVSVCLFTISENTE